MISIRLVLCTTELWISCQWSAAFVEITSESDIMIKSTALLYTVQCCTVNPWYIFVLYCRTLCPVSCLCYPVVHCVRCCTAAAHNVIADGFYEVGQLKESDQLRSVEEYGKEEVNDRRPVIVINPIIVDSKPELVYILFTCVVFTRCWLVCTAVT